MPSLPSAFAQEVSHEPVLRVGVETGFAAWVSYRLGYSESVGQLALSSLGYAARLIELCLCHP